MCTPRAKGVFPERHPLYVGVTGAGGHAAAAAYVERFRPRRTLVLGTRLGEASSFWDPRLVPEEGFVHVDLSASAFGAAYPEAHTLGFETEIGAFLEVLLPDVLRRSRCAWPTFDTPFPATPASRRSGPVRPAVLMDACSARSWKAATPWFSPSRATPSALVTTTGASWSRVAIARRQPGDRWATWCAAWWGPRWRQEGRRWPLLATAPCS